MFDHEIRGKREKEELKSKGLEEKCTDKKRYEQGNQLRQGIEVRNIRMEIVEILKIGSMGKHEQKKKEKRRELKK